MSAPATGYVLDPAASSLTVWTRAKGMLARLAHDLEIGARDIEGRATADAAAWLADVVVPTASLRVAGTLHGERVDTRALSPSDRTDIERRMRDEALGGAREIRLRAEGQARDRGTATLSIGDRPPARVALTLTVREDADPLVVSGRAEVSLRAIGSPEIRAPLGAFKVADVVEVRFQFTLRPATDPG
jgi:hypothetical protein